MESSPLDPAGESQNSAESFLHTCLPVSLQGGERGAWSHRLFPPCLQIEMLSPLEAVASRFREQYKTFAMALDTTRHELPVKSVHLDGDRQLFLDELQRELMTTRHLLGELGIGSSEDSVKVFDVLRELRDVIQKKDLELRRSVDQVLELSAEASKEAALINQEIWEEAQGPEALSWWYFNPKEATGGETQEEVRSPLGHAEL